MKTLIVIIICIIFLIISIPVSACTVFNATSGENTLIGNNEDWTDKNTYVWFESQENNEYGAIYFGFQNMWPQGGMNDQGLFFDWVMSGNTVTRLKPSHDRLNFNGNLSAEIMKKCSNIDEVLSMYEKYNQPAFGYCKAMYVDNSGDSAIIGWDYQNDKISVDRKKGSYQLLGYGAVFLQNVFMNNKYNVTIESFNNMISMAQQGDLTVYSNIYDPVNLEIYVYHMHDFNKVIKFNLKDELKKGDHSYKISSLYDKLLDTERMDKTEEQSDSDTSTEKIIVQEDKVENEKTSDTMEKSDRYRIFNIIVVIALIMGAVFTALMIFTGVFKKKNK